MSMQINFADWLAIANCKARYCRLLDSKDWDGWGGLMLPDFTLDVRGSGGPLIEGREAAVASVRASLENVRTCHQVHSPEIEIDADEARAVFAMQDRLIRPDGHAMQGWGHYHERYRRIDGTWLLASSRLTRLFMEIDEAPAQIL